MATALDTMIANLEVMLAALKANADPEQIKEHMTNPRHAHLNDKTFRLAFEQFDATRRNYPEFLTDDELAACWEGGKLELSEAHNLPCGLQDQISDSLQRYEDEKQVREVMQ